MKLKDQFKFKFSVVNGQKYLQIWKDGQFFKSCGTAEKLANKLVQYDYLLEQTKKFNEIKTKISNEVLKGSD